MDDRQATSSDHYRDGSEYDADEAEYLRACDDYRRRLRKRFLSLTDCRRVLLSLGYRKPIS